MQQVFIIHGFEGSPNGGWRPWLMTELRKLDIYACALSMPEPAHPQCADWVAEIARHVERDHMNEIYLVGHSLGVAAILRYLEDAADVRNVRGAVLISGRYEKTEDKPYAQFFEKPFDLSAVRSRVPSFAIIHGDDDAVVPVENAKMLSDGLEAPLIVIPKGAHLNGSAGWYELPQCLDALVAMLQPANS